MNDGITATESSVGIKEDSKSLDTNQHLDSKSFVNGIKSTEKPTTSPHRHLLEVIPQFDLEDIGERVEPINTEVKNILITGGAGFIGCFLVRKIVVLYPEYNVVVVDKLDYCGSLRNVGILKGMPNYTFIK
ncbi:2497_t:CDS:2, partial [Paraglomus occultum]